MWEILDSTWAFLSGEAQGRTNWVKGLDQVSTSPCEPLKPCPRNVWGAGKYVICRFLEICKYVICSYTSYPRRLAGSDRWGAGRVCFSA